MTHQSHPNPNGDASHNKFLQEQPLPPQTGYISTIASLRLWVKYRYMFRHSNARIEVLSCCFSVFSKLCQEIDEVLGDDKRGFEWTTISDDNGTPVWHWRLCESLDLKLAAFVSDQSLRVVLKNPPGDPDGRLRAAITLRVKEARAAARFMVNLLESTGGAQ
jgi:hypothetical protein